MSARPFFAFVLVAAMWLVVGGASARIDAPRGGGGGGGGGGCPGPSCDAEYLRLDTANDPLTSDLQGIAGTTSAPSFRTAGNAGFLDAVDPWFSGPSMALSVDGAVGMYLGDYGTATAYAVFTDLVNLQTGSIWSSTNAQISATAITKTSETMTFATRPSEVGTTTVRLSIGPENEGFPILAHTDLTTAPVWAFRGDSNTGIGRTAADTLCQYTGGTCRSSLSSSTLTLTVPVLAPGGSAGGPSYSFGGDSNTGVFSAGANSVSIAAGGADVFTWTTTNAQTLHVRPKTDNVSDLGSGSFRYANGFIDSVQSSTVAIGNGTVGAPSLTLSSEASGLYRPSAGVLGVSVGGNLAGAFGTDATFGRGLVTVGYLESPAIVNTPITPAEAASISCASGTLGSILTASNATDAETCICGLRGGVYDWEPVSGATCSFF